MQKTRKEVRRQRRRVIKNRSEFYDIWVKVYKYVPGKFSKSRPFAGVGHWRNYSKYYTKYPVNYSYEGWEDDSEWSYSHLLWVYMETHYWESTEFYYTGTEDDLTEEELAQYKRAGSGLANLKERGYDLRQD